MLRNLAIFWENRADSYTGLKDHDEAVRSLRKALEVTQSASKSQHEEDWFLYSLSLLHYKLGDAFLEKSDFRKALAHHADSLRAMVKRGQTFGISGADTNKLLIQYELVSLLETRLADYDDSAETLLHAVVFVDWLVAGDSSWLKAVPDLLSPNNLRVDRIKDKKLRIEMAREVKRLLLLVEKHGFGTKESTEMLKKAEKVLVAN